MRTNKKKTKGRLEQVLAEAKRNQEKRVTQYRDRALNMFPHICGRCGRDFSGKRIQELTVHHKDHNHDNNPSDGSNWELLCTYCHDMEHQRQLDEADYAYEEESAKQDRSSGHRPFAALKDLLEEKK